ncbi:MAG: DUF3786 domain-containing protein [Deltaproteobacteria bacterium]|nr:DUF3786 domain-containing protein [Deltaproteobacteria bacterium]
MGCASPNDFHWQDLANQPVEKVCGQPGVKLAPDGHSYEVQFLKALYRVDPVNHQIVEIGPNPARLLTEQFQILLIRYLVADNGGPVTGKEISEKDLQGGVTFFQGPHALYVEPIVKLYGAAPDEFEKRARELGAIPSTYGDKGMKFFPFPEIPVTYVLWTQDNEFPASVTIMFDKSIGRWFSLDMIFMVVLIVTERIDGR